MAGRKQAYRFFTPGIEGDDQRTNGFGSDEFDEADIWCCPIEPRPAAEFRTKPIPASRANRKKPDKGDPVTAAAASLPVSIPDWSKILKEESRGNGSFNNNNNNRLLEVDEDEDADTAGTVIPPHELLWRNRAASFSVHEGIGRTLKGRDLSRVRNAIFEKTGFQD